MAVEIEEWRSAPGWEGYYEVSSLGRVRSLTRASNPATGEHARKGKVLRLPIGSSGYPVVRLCKHGKAVSVTVHSLVLSAFEGPMPEGAECRHLDSNKLNARASNLKWGTQGENSKDRLASGGWDWPPNRKLTAEDVEDIRSASGVTQRQIAAKYGIGQGHVSAIRSGKKWGA